MMDGSLMPDMKTPAEYEYNVDVTRRVVEMAHGGGVSVEGELGCLGSLETGEMGEEDGHGAEGKLDKEMLLTDPEQAADFVKQTGVDALASRLRQADRRRRVGDRHRHQPRRLQVHPATDR
jgi:fructose-bisphosphate aldolase class II